MSANQGVAVELENVYPVNEKPLSLIPRLSPPVPAQTAPAPAPAPLFTLLPSTSPSLTESTELIEGSFSLLDNEKANFRYALVNLINQKLAKGDRPKGEVIKNILELYNSGLLLPNTYKKLGSISRATWYRWDKTLNEKGVEGLAPQKGQKGVAKITDHEMHYLLTFFLRPNRNKKASAITLTKEILEFKNIGSPSSGRTLRRFLDQFEKERYDLCVLARDGEKALKDKCTPHLKRNPRLLEVGDVIVGDGHRLNFQIINPYTGKPSRPILILFWDWRSAYPLGWEIMPEESVQCIASALRNSIITLGKIPKVVYLDNGKAFRAKIFTKDIMFEDEGFPGMFGRLGIKEHFAQPYNPQSKPVEREFRNLNEELERLIDTYTGSSIEDKPAWLKRNEKFVRSIQSSWIPNIDEANSLLFWWRDRRVERPHRGRDGQRPKDIFEAGKGPGVNPYELYYLMMDHEIRTIHRNGITWLNRDWYHEALYGLRDKVVIRYSLSDLSQIYVFYKNLYLCTAKPVGEVHPMATLSENPKDMEAVKEGIRSQRKTKKTTKRLLKMIWTKTASQADLDRPTAIQVAETIQAIEDKQKPQAMPISPWPNDFKQTMPAKILASAKNERPRFADEYERYRWIMQQEAIDEDDRQFVPEFRAKSLLYKDRIFTDDEELDSRVELWRQRNQISHEG